MKNGIYKGITLLVLAELCFASATVFVKIASTNTHIPAIEVTFFRFLVGFIVSGIVIYRSKISIKPNNKKLVFWRAMLNTVAVILFFLSVKHTTITNANMLNMTYPAFIFLFAPFITGEKSKASQFLYLVLTMIGIYLVIQPNFRVINMGDWYGLLSGIISALAIITLRMAREHDSTALILFYLMAIGTIINGIMLAPVAVVPTQKEFLAILASALLGFSGQAFITSGYRHIEAAKGSIVSSSRLIFAVMLGVLIFGEKLNFLLIIGGILILVSLIGVSWPRKTILQGNIVEANNSLAQNNH